MFRPVALSLAALVLLAGCVSIKFGRDFPSPDRQLIVLNKTDKPALEKLFGDPYQVGVDSGDPTWRWFYGHRDSDTELSKDLSAVQPRRHREVVRVHVEFSRRHRAAQVTAAPGGGSCPTSPCSGTPAAPTSRSARSWPPS